MSNYRNDAGQFCDLVTKIEDTFHLTRPTHLQTDVATWLLDSGADYENGAEGALGDLMYGGCQSGIVGTLVYYSDTTAYFQQHREAIEQLLTEAIDAMGCDGPRGLFGDKWDHEDMFPPRKSPNQNLLAWFAFEETARSLGDSAGYDC